MNTIVIQLDLTNIYMTKLELSPECKGGSIYTRIIFSCMYILYALMVGM